MDKNTSPSLKQNDKKSITYICHSCKSYTDILLKNINNISYIKCNNCDGKIYIKYEQNLLVIINVDKFLIFI